MAFHQQLIRYCRRPAPSGRPTMPMQCSSAICDGTKNEEPNGNVASRHVTAAARKIFFPNAESKRRICWGVLIPLKKKKNDALVYLASGGAAFPDPASCACARQSVTASRGRQGQAQAQAGRAGAVSAALRQGVFFLRRDAAACEPSLRRQVWPLAGARPREREAAAVQKAGACRVQAGLETNAQPRNPSRCFQNFRSGSLFCSCTFRLWFGASSSGCRRWRMARVLPTRNNTKASPCAHAYKHFAVSFVDSGRSNRSALSSSCRTPPPSRVGPFPGHSKPPQPSPFFFKKIRRSPAASRGEDQ
jgi:hypothetical protein